jgi:hypothetical protein
MRESEVVEYAGMSGIPNFYGQTCTLWTNVHFMDKKVHFMDKRCRYMDKSVVLWTNASYGQKVLPLGVYGKFGSPHGEKKYRQQKGAASGESGRERREEQRAQRGTTSGVRSSGSLRHHGRC